MPLHGFRHETVQYSIAGSIVRQKTKDSLFLPILKRATNPLRLRRQPVVEQHGVEPAGVAFLLRKVARAKRVTEGVTASEYALNDVATEPLLLPPSPGCAGRHLPHEGGIKATRFAPTLHTRKISVYHPTISIYIYLYSHISRITPCNLYTCFPQ